MPAAATSTTSPTPRRSATRSPPRSARRSRSSPATSTSRSPRATTSGSSRSARTRSRTGGNRTLVSLGDLGSEQVVEVVLRLSFPYGEIGRETGAIVALTDRDGDLRTRRVRRDRAPAIDLELRRRSRQRRPAARRRGRPCGRPPVRGPCPTGGGPAQPQRRLRGRPAHPRRAPRDASAATPGTIAVLRDLIDELGTEQVTFAAPMAEPSLQAGAFRERQHAAQPRRDGSIGEALLTGGAGRHRRIARWNACRDASPTTLPRNDPRRVQPSGRESTCMRRSRTRVAHRDHHGPGPAAARRRAGRGSRQRQDRA